MYAYFRDVVLLPRCLFTSVGSPFKLCSIATPWRPHGDAIVTPGDSWERAIQPERAIRPRVIARCPGIRYSHRFNLDRLYPPWNKGSDLTREVTVQRSSAPVGLVARAHSTRVFLNLLFVLFSFYIHWHSETDYDIWSNQNIKWGVAGPFLRHFHVLSYVIFTSFIAKSRYKMSAPLVDGLVSILLL